jgi:hypothetical protein
MLRRWRKRDDQHLVKAPAPVPVDPLGGLIGVVNEAQERDAEDERRLYRSKRAIGLNRGGSITANEL